VVVLLRTPLFERSKAVENIKKFLIGFSIVFGLALLTTLAFALIVMFLPKFMGVMEAFTALFVPTTWFYFHIAVGLVAFFIFMFVYFSFSYIAKEGPFK
jgi:F0F1-type ATP synthase membrane subunit a